MEGTPGAQCDRIRWMDWSAEAFEEARRTRKLVLLDLSAQWCHWCHVMDETTYSTPNIIRMVNEEFIPVRVDIDRRPDISERYNKGGFPTTAFLSDRGEHIWGGTHISPDGMERILNAVLDAMDSGEIREALVRNRMQFLHTTRALVKSESADSEFVDAIFEYIFSLHDVEWGASERARSSLIRTHWTSFSTRIWRRATRNSLTLPSPLWTT